MTSSRLCQDCEGRYFLDNSNSGFTFSVQDKPDLQLRDVLKAFVVPAAPEKQPVRELAATFVEQLDVAGYLAGKSPLVGLRLTHFKDGSLLGVSLSHAVAGKNGNRVPSAP